MTFGSLLLAPVLGLVRVNVDTHGATMGASLETKEMVRTSLGANASKGGDPYWATWTANAGLGDAKNWKALDLKVPLVGKAYKGYGGLPAGMAEAEMHMQQLEFKFTCQDPTRDELDRAVAWVRYDTHQDWSKKNKKRYRAMENGNVEVVYEYAGDPGKEYMKNAYHLMNSVLECKNLNVEVVQTLYPSEDDLDQNIAYAFSQLQSAAPEFYTVDKVNQALRAVFSMRSDRMRSGDARADIDAQMRKHDEQIRGLVDEGLLKQTADYVLLSTIDSWQMKRLDAKMGSSNSINDGMARFKFGHGSLTNLAKPGAGVNVEGWVGGVPKGQGKAKLAFEFTQDCTIDFTRFPSGENKEIPERLQGTQVEQDLAIGRGDEVYIHGNSPHKGKRGVVQGFNGGFQIKLQSGQTVTVKYPNLALDKSPANCWPGQKGLLVLTGDQSDHNQEFFPGEPRFPPSGNWKAERLVLYLAKGPN